jgi:hypothetical protein
MIIYDPRGMTWDQYNKLMEELFAGQQLGHVDETNWRQFADGMNGIGYFVQSGIPDHRACATWQEWAQMMVGIMSIVPNMNSQL